jgi:hypothetical protein
MSPRQVIEKAFDDAHVVVAEYLQPGPQNQEATIDRLIRILERKELFDALTVLVPASE